MNPKWNKLINPSINIMTDYCHKQLIESKDDHLMIRIFDKLAFFASRFEENKYNFLKIYKYISSFKLLNNSSIVGNLLRGFQKNKLYSESISLWQIYSMSNNINNNDNNDKK